MHRSPLSLAAVLASVLICGPAAAQLRAPLTPPAPPAASAATPVAQATPVPAGSGAAAAGAATPGAATPGAVTPVPPPPADASAAVRQVPSQPAAAAAASAAAASAAAPAARAGADDLDRPGAVTRALMAAQADGRRAGPGLPLQGPVASAAWQRYIQSFEQPLPQWFGTRIENKSGSGGGG